MTCGKPHAEYVEGMCFATQLGRGQGDAALRCRNPKCNLPLKKDGTCPRGCRQEDVVPRLHSQAAADLQAAGAGRPAAEQPVAGPPPARKKPRRGKKPFIPPYADPGPDGWKGPLAEELKAGVAFLYQRQFDWTLRGLDARADMQALLKTLGKGQEEQAAALAGLASLVRYVYADPRFQSAEDRAFLVRLDQAAGIAPDEPRCEVVGCGLSVHGDRCSRGHVQGQTSLQGSGGIVPVQDALAKRIGLVRGTMEDLAAAVGTATSVIQGLVPQAELAHVDIDYDEGQQGSYRGVTVHVGDAKLRFNTGDPEQDYAAAIKAAHAHASMVMLSSSVDQFTRDGDQYRWTDAETLQRVPDPSASIAWYSLEGLLGGKSPRTVAYTDEGTGDQLLRVAGRETVGALYRDTGAYGGEEVLSLVPTREEGYPVDFRHDALEVVRTWLEARGKDEEELAQSLPPEKFAQLETVTGPVRIHHAYGRDGYVSGYNYLLPGRTVGGGVYTEITADGWTVFDVRDVATALGQEAGRTAQDHLKMLQDAARHPAIGFLTDILRKHGHDATAADLPQATAEVPAGTRADGKFLGSLVGGEAQFERRGDLGERAWLVQGKKRDAVVWDNGQDEYEVLTFLPHDGTPAAKFHQDLVGLGKRVMRRRPPE